jgi:hypothetical protein
VNDVIMMDDPLSAVDAHVAEHIFTECITGLAKNKTRAFVTNQLHFLPRCDYIYVLHNGTIVERGTYTELSAGNNPQFKLLMKTHMEELSKEHGTKTLTPQSASADAAAAAAAGSEVKVDQSGEKKLTKRLSSKKPGAVPPTNEKALKRGQLIQKEELRSDKVAFTSYLEHFKAMGGWPWMLLLGLIFLIGQVSTPPRASINAMQVFDRCVRVHGTLHVSFLLLYRVFGSHFGHRTHSIVIIDFM